jgi:hypothetical protein
MKKILILITLIFLSREARAQTVTFNQTNVASAVQAQSFVYKLYVTPSGSTTVNTPVTLTSVNCTGTPPAVNCTGTVTASAATITGAKSTITATDPVSNLESVQSLPFIPPASVPTGLIIK